MSGGLERLRERMAEYLQAHGAAAAAAWPAEERARLTQPVTIVSLRGCRLEPAGFQSYLGERYDGERGQWVELYGQRAQLTLALDVYAPASLGEAGLQRALAAVAEACAAGGPEGLTIQTCTWGETEYDAQARLLKRRGEAVCAAHLLAEAEPGGAFLDFIIRGERRA